MDSKIKTKWIAALRSGEIKQAVKVLRSRDGAMCCLGVLAHVCGKAVDEVRAPPDGEILADSFAEPLGIYPSEQERLSHMNDHGGTFPEIADYIEKNL